jgi:hypothetical protein
MEQSTDITETTLELSDLQIRIICLPLFPTHHPLHRSFPLYLAPSLPTSLLCPLYLSPSLSALAPPFSTRPLPRYHCHLSRLSWHFLVSLAQEVWVETCVGRSVLALPVPWRGIAVPLFWSFHEQKLCNGLEWLRLCSMEPEELVMQSRGMHREHVRIFSHLSVGRVKKELHSIRSNASAS